MNKVSKLATKVVASTVAGLAGITAVVVLTASGGTVAADGACPNDMHWVICPTVDQVTDTVGTVTDTVGTVTNDMHW